jgi:hypothetical protein
MENQAITVGEIENLANWVHRVLPIQSFRQLVSVVVAAALVSLGFFGIFRVLPPAGVVVGMLLGMYPFLAGALPTRLRIKITGKPSLKREALENLEDAAFRIGYKSKNIVEGVVTLKPKLPRVLVWDENTVRLVDQQDAIVILGPLLATSFLRRKILKQVGV